MEPCPPAPIRPPFALTPPPSEDANKLLFPLVQLLLQDVAAEFNICRRFEEDVEEDDDVEDDELGIIIVLPIPETTGVNMPVVSPMLLTPPTPTPMPGFGIVFKLGLPIHSWKDVRLHLYFYGCVDFRSKLFCYYHY